MGSKMSPSFASLFVGLLEHNIILNPSKNPYLPYMVNYKRYLDDLCFIWTSTEDKLIEFHNFMNIQNAHLKFTMAYDASKMNFLDILILHDQGSLSTSLYRKPTDRNSLLHGESYHPTPLKKSLPISQLNRIRRICSSDTDFNVQRVQLEQRFLQRGHKKEWVTQASKRFENISQTECLNKTRTPNSENRIVCAIQYSPIAKEMTNIINDHWHIISTDPELKGHMSNPPRVVYKRPPNLRSMLVRSDCPPDPASSSQSIFSPVEPGNYKCNNCQQCHFTRKTQQFYHPHTGKAFNVRGIILCKTTNVIYMLKCPCGLAYIGKTSRALKTRISEHRSNIRNHDKKSPVAVHFSTLKHSVSTLSYVALEHVQLPRRGGDINSLLLKRELYWIYSLNTLSPNGLNEEMDIRPFL